MGKLKILLIDDERDFCMIMKSYFQLKNHEVFITPFLREGLKMLEEIKPDALVLDNNLPDGKGWDHLDAITKKFPSLKVYLVSAYQQKLNIAKPLPNVTIWEKPISLGLLDAVFR